MLNAEPLVTVLDLVALEVAMLEDSFGLDDLDNGTIAGIARQSRDALRSENMPDVDSDLVPVFSKRTDALIAQSFYASLRGQAIGRALDAHYGSLGGLNKFLTEQNVRVHPNLNKIGMMIDSRNVFRPTELDPVAQYEGLGAGTGTFMAGSDIDSAKYGEAALELISEDIGVSGRTLRLTLKNFDGTTETRDVVVPGGTASQTAFPVGAGGDRYMGVVTIVTVGGGGTAGDSFRVRSKVEREIVL